MYDDLIIFREGNAYFGLLAEDFETHIPIDEVKLSPSSFSDTVWSFSDPKTKLEGFLFHLGMVIGQSFTSISHQSYLFIREVNQINLAVMLANYQFRLPANQLNSLQVKPPHQAFRRLYRYKKLSILLLDPIALYQSYRSVLPSVR